MYGRMVDKFGLISARLCLSTRQDIKNWRSSSKYEGSNRVLVPQVFVHC
jgi:hypothetical protein